MSGSPPYFNAPQHTRKRDILVLRRRDSSEHIKELYPLGGYAMSTGMAPFKKTQYEGAVSTTYAATVTEEWAVYLLTGHSGTGKAVSSGRRVG